MSYLPSCLSACALDFRNDLQADVFLSLCECVIFINVGSTLNVGIFDARSILVSESHGGTKLTSFPRNHVRHLQHTIGSKENPMKSLERSGCECWFTQTLADCCGFLLSLSSFGSHSLEPLFLDEAMVTMTEASLPVRKTSSD